MITAQQIKEIALTLPRDRSNPRISRPGRFDNPYVCVYTDPDRPEMHCIAGEILTRLGLELPDVHSDSNAQNISRVAHVHDYPLGYDALLALDDLQYHADVATTYHPGGGAWEQAIHNVYEKDQA